MKRSDSNKLKGLLTELCETLKGKLSCSGNAMEYIGVGEFGLALEFLAEWCIDAEPQIFLSAKEIMKFKEIGDLMNMQGPWIELLPIMVSSELQNIPKVLANTARDYIKDQQAKNPERNLWLSKIQSKVNEIESPV